MFWCEAIAPAQSCGLQRFGLARKYQAWIFIALQPTSGKRILSQQLNNEASCGQRTKKERISNLSAELAGGGIDRWIRLR
jgi:hypothetical protein